MITTSELRRIATRSGARQIRNVEIDIILTLLLQLFHERGLLDHLAFKGGTMLRKMVFGPRVLLRRCARDRTFDSAWGLGIPCVIAAAWREDIRPGAPRACSNRSSAASPGTRVPVFCAMVSGSPLGARAVVVLSLGAMCTPRLLMLAGIGDEAELRKPSIPVVLPLPGVRYFFGHHGVL